MSFSFIYLLLFVLIVLELIGPTVVTVGYHTLSITEQQRKCHVHREAIQKLTAVSALWSFKD